MVLPQVPLELLPMIAQDITLRRALRLYWILKVYAGPDIKQSLAHKLLRRHGCSYHEITKYIPWLIEKRMMGKDKVKYYLRSQGDLGKLIPDHPTLKMRGVRFDVEVLSNRKAYEDMMASLLVRREATRVSFQAKKLAKHRSYSVLLAKALHRASPNVSEKRRLKLEEHARTRSNMKHGPSQAPIIESRISLAQLGDVIPGTSLATLSRFRKRASFVKGVTLRENFTGCPFPEHEVADEIARRETGFVKSKYHNCIGVPKPMMTVAKDRLLPDGNMPEYMIKVIDDSIPHFIRKGVLPHDYTCEWKEAPERAWNRMRVIGGVPLMQEISSVICAPLQAKCMTVKAPGKRRALRTPESVAKHQAMRELSDAYNQDRAMELKAAFSDVKMMEKMLAETGAGRYDRKGRMQGYKKLYKSIIFS